MGQREPQRKSGRERHTCTHAQTETGIQTEYETKKRIDRDFRDLKFTKLNDEKKLSLTVFPHYKVK